MKTEISGIAAMSRNSNPIWIFDIDSHRMYWANSAAVRIWQASSLTELCDRDMSIGMSLTIKKRLNQYQVDFARGAKEFYEQWTIYPNNEPVSLSMRISGYELPNGRIGMLSEAKEIVRDTPEALRSVEALLHTAVMISLYQDSGRVLYRNPAARESVLQFEMSLSERIVKAAELSQLLDEVSATGEAMHVMQVLTVRGKRWHEISARKCKDVVTGKDAILLSEVDVSSIKYAQAHSNHIAKHDALTGLPNRSHVFQTFQDSVVASDDTSLKAAVIFIDLDNFKDINDTLGHLAGDALLVEVAHRLCSVVRTTDMVARLGGDEFLILISGKNIEKEIDALRSRLARSIEKPIPINGNEVQITASAGVAIFPEHGRDINTLMRNADLAMYNSKAKGRDAFSFYEESMSHAVLMRLELEKDIRRALQNKEFEVYFQPRVCVQTNKIMGAEALARWRHPTLGLIGPDVFIETCERLGLIGVLSEIVFIEAARQQRIWALCGYTLVVSINLSPKQICKADFLDTIKSMMSKVACDPSFLEFEITESILLGKNQLNRENIAGLRKLGFTIAIDDFGTGYSNLAYLSQFEVNALKIDKSFVQGIEFNRPVAELIVSLCKLMKLTIVAEGVEDQCQLDWAKSQGIEQYQGFLFERPVSSSVFTRLLKLDLSGLIC